MFKLNNFFWLMGWGVFFSATVVGGGRTDFLRSPPHEMASLTQPKVISIGCGKSMDVEVDALDKLYPLGFSYVCVEVNPDKVRELNASIKLAYVKVVNADASNVEVLKELGLLRADYDIAIVRHPDFHSFQVEFCRIFREVLPMLVTDQGFVVVSLLSEYEKRFLVREDKSKAHKYVNTLLTDIQYELVAELDLLAPKTPLLDGGAVRDKFMYYLRNKTNTKRELKERFRLHAQPSDNPQMFSSLVTKLGGKVLSQTDEMMIVSVVPTYMNSIDNYYGRHSERMVTSAGSCFTCQKSASDEVKFKVCSKCKQATYCSVQCQREHWPLHKTTCH